jgi:acetyl esterase/lipase
MPNPFAPFFVTDVFTYKTFQDTPIQTDVHVPKDIEPGENLPMLLLMHGGSLVCGVIFSPSSCVISTFVQYSILLDHAGTNISSISRLTFASQIAGHRRMWPLLCGPWLATFAAKHKAIVVVPDYRLAPETKTPEILADLVSFWEWVHGVFPSLLKGKRSVTPDLSKLAIRGESAGGWCALHLSLLYPQEIRASILAWPMVDTESDWYKVGSGNSIMMGMPPFPKDQTEKYLASMNMNAVTTQGGHDRFPIAIGGVQNGFAHIIWGKSEETFVLRALERGCAKLPKFVWISHGKDDTAVPLEGSEKLVRLIKINSAGTSVRFDVKPGDHGFDNNVPFEEEWLQEALKQVAAAWLA